MLSQTVAQQIVVTRRRCQSACSNRGLKARALALGALAAGLFLVGSNAGFAQAVTEINDSTITPQPSSGHDYIPLLDETVNPATGSVSFRINIPLPKQRGFNLPFSIAYDSNTYTAPQQGWYQDNFGYMEPTIAGLSQPGGNPCRDGGWYNTFPCLSAVETRETFPVVQTGPYQSSITLDYMNGYVFYDPSGAPHALYMQIGNACTETVGIAGGCSSLTPSATGGDGLYTSSTSALDGWPGGSVSTLVTDADGTVYSFNFPPRSPSQVNTAYSAGLNYIEDRNGNKITLSGTSITDSLGRPLLSSSSSSPNTISVSGISNPYTVTSGATGASGRLTLKATPASAETSNSYCFEVYSYDVIVPQTGITAITLPNGQAYQFTYDPTYGVLKSITYPNNTVVSYDWGITPEMWQQYFYVTYDEQANFSVHDIFHNTNCPYLYDALTVSGRHVFVGGNEVLTQSFTYTPDTTYGRTLTTTVTTTDDVTGKKTFASMTYERDPINANNSLPSILGGGGNACTTGVCWTVSSGTTASGYVSNEKTETISDSSGLLKAVTKAWTQYQYQWLLQSVTTTLGPSLSGPTSEDVYSYGCGGQVTEHDEYGFGAIGAASPTRKTVTQYQSFNTTPIFPSATSICDRPSSVITYDSGNNKVAETDYSYDQGGVATVSATMHDETNYGTGSTAARGNATTVTKKCFGCTADATTTYTYDETGQVTSRTDPCGNGTCADMSSTNHTTTYSYTDSPSGGNAAGNSNAYLTQVTYPATNNVSHVESFQYNYATGKLTKAVDENSQPTDYAYNDPFNRLTGAQGPPDANNGGLRPTTAYSYNDSSSTPSITTETTLNAGLSKTAVQIMDGLGRTIHTQITSDPGGTDYVNTIYDGSGHIYEQSNPTRCSSAAGAMPTSCSESTWGITSFNYDGLGRKTLKQTTPNTGSESWVYSGNVTTFTNESANSWRQTADAFGNLIQAVEPGTLTTTYAYNALNDLLSVNQLGNSGSDTPRTRGFSYNSLSQLIAATNPESGAITYSYDSNGNVHTKTDARGIITTYSYDALNRILQKSYSDNITPWTCYQYDSSSVPYGLGRIANEWTQSASSGSCAVTMPATGFLTARSILSYNPMGNVLSEKQYTLRSIAGGTSYPMTYTYDLTGNLTSSTTGSTPPWMTLASPAAPCQNAPPFSVTMPTFVNCVDSAGRLSSITNNVGAAPGTLFSAPAYAAFGGLTGAIYGSSAVTLTKSYDSRLRLATEVDTGNTATSTSGSAVVTITGTEQRQ